MHKMFCCPLGFSLVSWPKINWGPVVAFGNLFPEPPHGSGSIGILSPLAFQFECCFCTCFESLFNVDFGNRSRQLISCCRLTLKSPQSSEESSLFLLELELGPDNAFCRQAKYNANKKNTVTGLMLQQAYSKPKELQNETFTEQQVL